MGKSQVTISKRKRNLFLENLRRTGKIKLSAQCAGYADSTYLRRLYNNDEDFARQWDEALLIAADDILEPELMRRAVEGIDKPVYYKGEHVATDVQYSDQLLMFALKAAKPDKYRDNVKVEGSIEGNFGVAVMPAMNPNVENWEQQASQLSENQHKNLNKDSIVDAEFEEINNENTKIVRG